MHKLSKISGVVCALAFAVPNMAKAETIGAYTVIDAPDSAQLIAGGGGLWGSCTAANAPMSVNDAFSGFGIADNGFCNGEAGTTIQFNFAAPVVNAVGDDLVFFDGRFSVNDYDFSTSYDSFSASLALLGADAVNTGVGKSYYYFGAGPYGAGVFAHTIDLSDLGVPLGDSVISVRIAGTSGEVDPLGVGTLVPEPASIALLLAGVPFIGRRRK